MSTPAASASGETTYSYYSSSPFSSEIDVTDYAAMSLFDHGPLIRDDPDDVYIKRNEMGLYQDWLSLPHPGLQSASVLESLRSRGVVPVHDPQVEARVCAIITPYQEEKFRLCVLGIVERHIELAQERLQEIREGFVRVAEVLKTEMMDALDMDEEQMEARLREDMAGRT